MKSSYVAYILLYVVINSNNAIYVPQIKLSDLASENVKLSEAAETTRLDLERNDSVLREQVTSLHESLENETSLKQAVIAEYDLYKVGAMRV